MRIFFGFLVLVLIVGCTATSNVQTGTYKYLYDYESRDLHPEYVLYHHADDSSTLFFRINSAELLYARSSAQAPFMAHLSLNVTVSDINGAMNDTIHLDVQDPQKSRQGWLMGSLKVPMAAGNWNLLMEFSDLTKNITQSSYMVADKSTKFGSQNYLIKNFETDEPIFNSFVSSGQKVSISSGRNADAETPALLQLVSEYKLPPPPFSTNSPELPSLTGASAVNFKRAGDGSSAFVVEKGNYFFTYDPTQKVGLTIKTANTFYPEVKEIESLEWPLRYITTKTEHEEIVKNSYPKKMIDKFWLECAGNKDHARELIKVYYKRVEEANYYFSSYTEGWRTDRGMIHLIFGNPTRIDKFANTETWQYGEEGTAGLLSFVFHKVESPMSTNVYILDRDPGYKPYWEKMVQTWRNGRVYND